MNNTNQNHTDIFFRQGLSSPPEFTPSEQNWKDMEKLLKPEAKRRGIGWIYMASGIAAVLLIFLSLWLIPQQKTSRVQQVKAIKNKEPYTPAKIRTNTAPPQADDQTIVKNNHVDKKNSITSEHVEKSLQLTNNQDQVINTPETGLELTIRPKTLNSAGFLNVQGSLTNQSADKAEVSMITLNTLDKAITQANSEVLTANNDSSPRSKDFSSRWALSMAVSPDLNSVTSVGKSKFGVSLGAGVSYNLNTAISVGTGIYYSQKLYSADKTSYKVTQKPFATWTSYSKRIDAECRVIDIPLNFSFRMSNTKQNKLYATAGLSSYIMLSEKYNFIYNRSPAYPSGGREYTINNQNRHILSVMNLGIALEKPLADQVSLVILPYAKIPLTGIGQGETDLKSFGLGFKLNYSLGNKRD